MKSIVSTRLAWRNKFPGQILSLRFFTECHWTYAAVVQLYSLFCRLPWLRMIAMSVKQKSVTQQVLCCATFIDHLCCMQSHIIEEPSRREPSKIHQRNFNLVPFQTFFQSNTKNLRYFYCREFFTTLKLFSGFDPHRMGHWTWHLFHFS